METLTCKVEWTDIASPGELATYISAYQHRQVRQVTPQNQSRPVNSQGRVLIVVISAPERNET